MTESQLDRAIADICALLNVWRFHVYDSRRSPSGWPDLALIGRGRIIFRELKTDAGRISETQAKVGELLTQAGQSWDVWRPADLMSGRILAELREII
jgi:hypothetical protein